MKNRLSPSVLAADFGALREDIYLAEETGAESFHFDIMDGHFVPNLSYGLSLVSALRKNFLTCILWWTIQTFIFRCVRKPERTESVFMWKRLRILTAPFMR